MKSSSFLVISIIILVNVSFGQINSKRKQKYLPSILPNPGECGQVKSTDEYRDENEIAHLGQFPWTVQIAFFYLKYYQYNFGCNGVLINTNHILTQGVCVISVYALTHYRTRPQYVRLGDWNPNTTVDCSGDICSDPQIEIPVLRTFTRLEKSLDRPWVVNIGIIKLAYSVQYTNWISPICLPYADHLYQNDHNYLGATFITTGWSLNKGKHPELKYKINVKVINDDQCDEIYNRARKSNKYYDPYTNFCIFRDNVVCKDVATMMAIDTTNILQPYWYVVGIPVQEPPCRGYTMCEKVITHMQWIKYILSIGYGEYDERRLPFFNITEFNYTNQKGEWGKKNSIFPQNHVFH